MALVFTDWENFTDTETSETGTIQWTDEVLKNAPTLFPYLEAIRQACYERHQAKGFYSGASNLRYNDVLLRNSPLVSQKRSPYTDTVMDFKSLDRLVIFCGYYGVIVPGEFDGEATITTAMDWADYLVQIGESPYTYPLGNGLYSYNSPINPHWFVQARNILSGIVRFTNWYSYTIKTSFFDFRTPLTGKTIDWVYPYESAVSSFLASSWTSSFSGTGSHWGYRDRISPPGAYIFRRSRCQWYFNNDPTDFNLGIDLYVYPQNPQSMIESQYYVNRDYEWDWHKYNKIASIAPSNHFDDVTVADIGDIDSVSVLEADITNGPYYSYGWTVGTPVIVIKGDVPGGFIFQ